MKHMEMSGTELQVTCFHQTSFIPINMAKLDREIEIVHQLAEKVLEYEPILAEISDICGELDWYVAPFR